MMLQWWCVDPDQQRTVRTMLRIAESALRSVRGTVTLDIKENTHGPGTRDPIASR
jgi:hypothetical protein